MRKKTTKNLAIKNRAQVLKDLERGIEMAQSNSWISQDLLKRVRIFIKLIERGSRIPVASQGADVSINLINGLIEKGKTA